MGDKKYLYVLAIMKDALMTHIPIILTIHLKSINQ
jgi:hypothetical protein